MDMSLSSYPFLSVDYYSEIADICVIYDNDTLPESILPNTTIFIRTDLLVKHIGKLLMYRTPFILITACNDDLCVPYFTDPAPSDHIKQIMDHLLNSPYLLVWFSKNVAIQHSKLKGIPLGPKWQWSSTAFYGENISGHLQLYKENYMKPQDAFLHKEKLLYINMDITTTRAPLFKAHTDMRKNILIDLVDKGFTVTPPTNIKGYINDLKAHKFCVSPPGRGIDSHRTWEALMVGTIPICLSSPLDYIYSQLPVLIIKDYSVITEKYLLEQYDLIKERDYDFTLLYGDYWKNLIKSPTQYLH
jgi:hypothetical protein